jgi:hypothetical protein
MSDLIGYADFAKALNISVESVRVYAVRDPDFPHRANPKTERSPLFRPEQLEEYRRQKRDRARGRAGRPPLAQDSSERISTGRTTGDRIRELVEAHDSPVSDVRALAGLLRLEVPALRYRLRGQTRWKPAELKAIARVFRVPINSIIAEPTSAWRGSEQERQSM